MRARVRKAFTLVEILIVVVILGILAAIVVPQFTNATQDAQGGNIQSQLDTLNNQIELFKARNNGTLPGGTTMVAYDWASMVSGGYIKAAPRNPACPSSGDPTAIAAPGTADVGWHWDAATNTLLAAYFDESTTGPTALKVTPGVP
jgi:general secretion pathway protein G